MTDTTVPRRTARRTQRRPGFALLVLHGPGRLEGQAIPLPPQPIVLGRNPAPGVIALGDPRVSRAHATLVTDGAQVRLVDQSSNGTFVEGQPVEAATLSDGALIRVGDTFLLLRERGEPVAPHAVEGLAGESDAMARLRSEIALVGPTSASVLVLGPSGSGKELVARGLHAASGRAGSLVCVNCAAVPDALAESMLFGHAAGAFTGARSDHEGLLRRAHRGTLFLDEIGELSLPLQAKLLRVTEQRVVSPVGGSREVPIDVRFVGATHRDLRRAVDEGSFRGDLFARLSDITIRTPSLVARREDILPLFLAALGPPAPELEPELVEALLLHEWPYNVRELQKCAAEARVRSPDARPMRVELVAERFRPRGDRPSGSLSVAEGPLDRDRVRSTYAELGSVAATARALGRSRRQIRRYLDGIAAGEPED